MNGNETSAEFPAPPVDEMTPPPPPPKKHISLTIPALMTALIALAFSFYTLIQEERIKETVQAQTRDLTQIMHTLTAQQKTERNNLQNITRQITDLQTTVSKIESLKRENEETWMVLKARSALELAQIQMHWSHDTEAVMNLLQQADTQLSQANISALFPVREIIAKNIAALKTEPKLDIPGVLSQLNAARNLTDNIPVQTKTLAPAPKTDTVPDVDNTWRSHLKNSLQTLEKMVVIRKPDTEVKPLLSALHITLLRENIRLNLQEAEWAVLKRNDLIYQNALNQAIANVKRTFDMDSEITKNFMKQLQSLKTIQLEPQKLDIQPSLDKLNEWIKQQSNYSTEQ